jgi:hypothetical protein
MDGCTLTVTYTYIPCVDPLPSFTHAGETIEPGERSMPVSTSSINLEILEMVDSESGRIIRYADPAHSAYGWLIDYDPWAGDLADDSSVRGLASFDISTLPPDANIQSASLDISERTTEGNPFVSLGDLEILAVEYELINGDSFDSSGTVIYSGALGASIDVTESVREAHRMSRDRWQIRLQFRSPTDGDNSTDFIVFPRGSDGCVLNITYTRR